MKHPRLETWDGIAVFGVVKIANIFAENIFFLNHKIGPS
jgi:hypothetical protein